MNILVQVLSAPNSKFIMINRFLLILAVAFFPIITFAQNRVEVKDPEIKFSYILPEGWKVNDDGYDYKIESKDSKNAYISLTYVEKATGNKKFDSVVESQSFKDDFQFELDYNLPDEMKNFQLEETGNSTIDGVPALWAKFSHGEKQDQTGVFYMFQKLNQSFKILGSSPASASEKVKPIFTGIIQSFKAEKQ